MPDGSRLNSVFKHTVKKEITLLASSWSSAAPYTQTVAMDEYVDDLQVDANIVYSGDLSVDKELNKAASCFSYIKKNGKAITFYCLEEKPEVDIPVEITYEGINNIANVTIYEGVELNFKVICGQQPETADENTIWIDTDQINNYYFSTTQPEGVKNYDIWIYTADHSNVEFNAMKNNGIQVYPISVKQYIGDAWVDKTAKIWKSGEWVDWATYLYKFGDKCVDITGGWLTRTTSDGYGMTPSISITAPYMSISASGNSANGVAYTSNKIDISNFNKLKCKHGEVYRTQGLYFGILDDSFKYWGSMPAYVDINTSNTETVVDISNIQGMYRIGFILRTLGNNTAYINNITSITLE